MTEPAFGEQEQQEAIVPQRRIPWLGIVITLLALVLVYALYAQHSMHQELASQIEKADHQLTQLGTRAATLENDFSNMKADLDVASNKLGVTEKELTQARAQARKLRQEQKQTAEQLNSQLQDHQSRLESITGEVGEVKDTVASTQQNLAATQSKLESTIGDLGVQSGLVARNQDELEQLKKLGERDYYDFDLRKSKQFSRVGAVSVRLNKVDTKRNKYTVTLLLNDKVIEKKDKTLFEPVQFYLPGTRHLLELVAFKLDKNEASGYLSAPKTLALNNTSKTTKN